MLLQHIYALICTCKLSRTSIVHLSKNPLRRTSEQIHIYIYIYLKFIWDLFLRIYNPYFILKSNQKYEISKAENVGKR